MNQLRDISMDKAFAGSCGITEPELTAAFEPEILGLAEEQKMTPEEALAEMRKRYNGYRFAPGAEPVNTFRPKPTATKDAPTPL